MKKMLQQVQLLFFNTRDTYITIHLNRNLVFVGFGSCLDVFTSASELFTAMNYTQFPEPNEFGVLTNQNEFLSEFGYYFQQGAAAERNDSNYLQIMFIIQSATTSYSYPSPDSLFLKS